ncbi:MAG: hypothetical protein JWN34_1575 [Bryobacterales bacterium]|nr:hypothetical protein [Bryobacterales bacterium]
MFNVGVLGAGLFLQALESTLENYYAVIFLKSAGEFQSFEAHVELFSFDPLHSGWQANSLGRNPCTVAMFGRGASMSNRA